MFFIHSIIPTLRKTLLSEFSLHNDGLGWGEGGVELRVTLETKRKCPEQIDVINFKSVNIMTFGTGTHKSYFELLLKGRGNYGL